MAQLQDILHERRSPQLVRAQHIDEENEDEPREEIDQDHPNPNYHNRLTRLMSIIPRVDIKDLVNNEINLKEALYYHICDPISRWKVKRVVPYKFILQIIKTVLILLQVSLFIYSLPSNRSVFFVEARSLFNQLFYKNNSLYTQQNLLNEITYAVERYYQLPNLTLGGYSYMLDSSGDILPVQVLLRQYKEVYLEPSNYTAVLDDTIIAVTFNLMADSNNSVTEQLTTAGFAIDKFIDMTLLLYLNNIRIVRKKIECFLFTITIKYSNLEHHGIIKHSLDVDEKKTKCNVMSNQNEAGEIALTISTIIIDVTVIILCFVSAVFVIIKYCRAYYLGRAMRKFYHTKLNQTFSWWNCHPLFSIWLLLIFISDGFLIFGSLYKILLEFNVIFGSASIRIVLGTAVLVNTATILRYISLFKSLNVLTRTMRLAFPEVVKFMLCTFILFISFAICGSVIFAPYNERFSDFSKTLQSLFVLSNGDEIYPMLRSFDNTYDIGVYVFGQVFIYIFVVLFIYAVLNLFTSLIIKIYENSSKEESATADEVRKFVFSGPLTKEGRSLRDLYGGKVDQYVHPSLILNNLRCGDSVSEDRNSVPNNRDSILEDNIVHLEIQEFVL